MKQGSFALAGLCCPDRQRYYDPLGLPLDRRPLHGAAAYRPALLPPPAGAGSRRVSPVPRTTFRPFHALYAGRFLRTRSRLPGAFRGLRPVRAGSAPPWPPQAVNNYDAADFASCCGPAVRSSPLRTPPLGDARGIHYRGPWRLPGPDSHRLVALSLSIGFASVDLCARSPGRARTCVRLREAFLCCGQPIDSGLQRACWNWYTASAQNRWRVSA
jgi:hypothetical protein